MGNNRIYGENSKIENNKVNESGDQNNFKVSPESSYKIISETYDNNKGTKINYPQITDLSDAEKKTFNCRSIG